MVDYGRGELPITPVTEEVGGLRAMGYRVRPRTIVRTWVCVLTGIHSLSVGVADGLFAYTVRCIIVS